MEIKLKSVFQNHKLRLVAKTLAFAALLMLLQSGSFGFWPVILFFAGTLFLYVTPLFRTAEFVPLFLVLLAGTFLIFSSFNTGVYFWAVIVYCSALFYLLTGLKELAFVRREIWQRIFALGLAYPLFLVFFYYDQASILLRLLALFLGLLILAQSIVIRRLPGWAVSFLALEIAWSVALLPIGFVSQSGLAALAYFALVDIAYYYYIEKRLSARIILVHATLLTLLTVLVFALSRWGL